MAAVIPTTLKDDQGNPVRVLAVMAVDQNGNYVILGGGGGGSGGAITIEDGDDETQGAKTDGAWNFSSGNPSIVSILKAGALALNAMAESTSSTAPVPTSPHGPRDSQGDIDVDHGNNTNFEDLLAAPAGGATTTARDITSIVLTNTSGTDTVVELYDEDDSNRRTKLIAKAGDVRGVAWPQGLKGAPGKEWHWKLGTAVSGVTATVTYVDRTV